MLVKTSGIVIRYIKYRETSVIVDIFTREGGMTSFLVNGVRSKKPKFPISFFQPLTILEMVMYQKNKEGLQRFSEVRVKTVYNSVNTDIKKSTIALFLSEILFKSLRHESDPSNIYDFLENSFIYFDMQNSSVSEFHLKFLIKLTGFLGFSPGNSATLMDQLLQEDTSLEGMIGQLMESDYSDSPITKYNERIKILNHLIDYFKIHIEGFGELKSFKILQEILH